MPIGAFCYGKISPDILLWVIILVVVPFAGYGFMNFKGMPFEQFVKVLWSFYLLPQIRVHEDTEVNLFETLNSSAVDLEILQQRLDAGEFEETEQEWRG